MVVTNEDLHVLATGEATYECRPNVPPGHFEQSTTDWQTALQTAMQQVHTQLQQANNNNNNDNNNNNNNENNNDNNNDTFKVLAIGIAGQMHGQVMAGDLASASDHPTSLPTALTWVRLWCDARNQAEGDELTQAFRYQVPKRSTAARFLWTTRHDPALAARVRHLTTPAGWLAFLLTGEFYLGMGDAAGMFPMDVTTGNYDSKLLQLYDDIVNNPNIPALASLLPTVKRAGEPAGWLNQRGAHLLQLPPGIPVAAAEGDQVAALAGSCMGRPGMVSCSFGTSVCANVIGTQPFRGVSPAVDLFCSADGQPILMIWLRNGTTFLNTIVETTLGSTFEDIMPQLLAAPADCGGLLALPFMHDEPGLQVPPNDDGSTALILGWTAENATPGNVAKAALLSTMFNLRLGCQVLDDQGYPPRTEIGFSGGLAKTPETGQILANVFQTPVTLLEAAEEGCAWGAAVLAKYRHVPPEERGDWPLFLEAIAAQRPVQRFLPQPEQVAVYETVFQRYQKLIQLQPQLAEIYHMSS